MQTDLILHYRYAYIKVYANKIADLNSTAGAVRSISTLVTHFILETSKWYLAKRADQDQKSQNTPSDLGLKYFANHSAIFLQKYLN